MPLGSRLKELRQEKMLTQAQLGSFFNLAESTISLYETGKRTPDYDILKGFALFFNVCFEYLLGYTDERQPAIAMNENSPDYESEKGRFLKLPVVNAVKLGKYGISYLNSPQFEWFYTKEIARNICYWLQASDDAMKEAGLFLGDLVLIHEQAKVNNGDIGVILIDDNPGIIRYVFRKDNTLLLLPANPAYEPLIFSGKELSKIKVIGKALEIRRKLEMQP